jgi:hypothetical protein
MLEAAAAAGGTFDLLSRARVRLDTGNASTCLRSAKELLLTVGGAASMAVANSVQRHWRDLQTAARRPTINTGLIPEVYARALVGNQEQSTSRCEPPTERHLHFLRQGFAAVTESARPRPHRGKCQTARRSPAAPKRSAILRA